MGVLERVTDGFVRASREIFGDELVGIYLHGSAVMGCFNEEKSDIDLLVAVKGAVPDGVKRRFMDMVVELDGSAPEKGIELSVVREEVCRDFRYPTPFELHFSRGHLDWYNRDPEDYIRKMKGTDRDLAAHFTIVRHRGKCLFGKAIGEVFGEVKREYYLDSIQRDIQNAKEDVAGDPVYIILNLCRVLAYKQEGLILSKREGGEWGLRSLPEEYRGLVSLALEAYLRGGAAAFDGELASQYAAYMLARIKERGARQNPEKKLDRTQQE